MLSSTDKDILTKRGITEQQLFTQLERFKTGFPYLKLEASATVGNGIVGIEADLKQKALARWEQYLSDGGSVTKFVPASGAASRMFKSLLAFVNSEDNEPKANSDVAQLLENIDKMPFSGELDKVLQKKYSRSLAEMMTAARYKDIVRAITHEDGMNYGGLPKGLLSFHRYDREHVRTPLEEQMVEGAQTAKTSKGVNLHFTVSGNHEELFRRKIEEIRPRLEKEYDTTFNIELSRQQPSTDTIAADLDGNLFRDSSGNMVFRPGGHGALIANLSDVESTVVFIKNIDNVVPDSERDITVEYKKILAGILILAHDRITAYVEELREGNVTRKELDKMVDFLENTLSLHKEGLDALSDKELAEYLLGKFDRPLRVCGMVVNEGEPGGGPYLAYNADGSYSPQILESTQIDKSDIRSLKLMSQATHFNPVDLVCYIRDTQGHPYDLSKYVDNETGFISQKSYEGRDLQALELPGLWNGAMSDWSTIFVEVPAKTFNPVKTVNDLLRPIHQADK